MVKASARCRCRCRRCRCRWPPVLVPLIPSCSSHCECHLQQVFLLLAQCGVIVTCCTVNLPPPHFARVPGSECQSESLLTATHKPSHADHSPIRHSLVRSTLQNITHPIISLAHLSHLCCPWPLALLDVHPGPHSQRVPFLLSFPLFIN